MREREVMIQTVKASEARAQWSQILNKVFRRQARVVVEKSGIPVAAIISTEDLERLTQLEQQRAERFRALDATRDTFKNGPDEELKSPVSNRSRSRLRGLTAARFFLSYRSPVVSDPSGRTAVWTSRGFSAILSV